jgi:alkylhydroperoxidase family enzyme
LSSVICFKTLTFYFPVSLISHRVKSYNVIVCDFPNHTSSTYHNTIMPKDIKMQRYILTDYENASSETQEVYNDYMRTTGATSVPIWLQSLGHSHALAKAYWERAKGTLFGGNLPLPLKEMIVFIVSAQNGARYCAACHAQCVLNLDKALSLEDLKSIIQPDSNFELPAYYRKVAAFASKVAEKANAVEDEDFEILMDEGFSRQEICEIIAVIDLATMFNVYTSTLRLDLDPEYCAVL